ncbi:MAG: hypothetical protein WCX46_02745 [Candidatus Paceibacterota bacterium]
MKIVTVMPFKKGVLKDEFTYFSAKNIENGDIVNIPMRNKKNLGLVISANDVSKEKSNIKDMPYNLKKIDEVKEKSIFSKNFINSLFSISNYFCIKKNLVFSSLIPSVMIQEYDKISTLDMKFIDYEKKENITKNLKVEKLLFQAQKNDRIHFYKTLIRGSFANKKSVFIVFPTEKDIEDFYKLLSKGIESFTFLIHGGFSKKKQIDKIQNILECEHPILILATAPFLSINRNDIKTIILEHENSNAYKTISKPNIDLRIFTEVFAFNIGAKIIMADSLLRIETIARKETENLGEIYPLSFRTNFDGEIKITSKNKDIDKQNKKFSILDIETIDEIKKSINKKENIFIFSLRKGLATMTICKDCGNSISCDECLAPIVLYQNQNNDKRIFICNKCGKDFNTDTICNSCSSWNLLPLGIGTDTVYEEIKKNFPTVKIFKLDRENVKNAKEAEKIIMEYEENKGSILIGTEMALFYINKKIPLSIIASFDSLWSIPNFRMSEKIIKIITSILNKTENKLIIETKNEEDKIINSVKIDNLISFVREENRDRKNLGYPPYKRFIKISFLGNKIDTVAVRKYLLENFMEYNPDIFSGFMPKLKDKFMTNTLIKVEPYNWSLPELIHNSKIDEILSEKISLLPSEFSISIDPEDLS